MRFSLLPLALALYFFQSYSLCPLTIQKKVTKILKSSTESINTQISKKWRALEQEALVFKKSHAWKKMSFVLDAYKKTPEYQTIHKQQEALNLLYVIENSLEQIPYSEILKSISSLLKEKTFLDNATRSFFQKERARLMDNTDEALLIRKKQDSLSSLRLSLIENLKNNVIQLQKTELYKKVIETHKQYEAEKKVKKMRTLCEKIKSLEREKEIQKLTDKQSVSLRDKQELLLVQTKAPQIFKPLPPGEQSLNRIQLDLFLAPIDIITL